MAKENESHFFNQQDIILTPRAGSSITEAFMEAWNKIRDNQKTIARIRFNFNDTIIEIYMKDNAIYRAERLHF